MVGRPRTTHNLLEDVSYLAAVLSPHSPPPHQPASSRFLHSAIRAPHSNALRIPTHSALQRAPHSNALRPPLRSALQRAPHSNALHTPTRSALQRAPHSNALRTPTRSALRGPRSAPAFTRFLPMAHGILTMAHGMDEPRTTIPHLVAVPMRLSPKVPAPLRRSTSMRSPPSASSRCQSSRVSTHLVQSCYPPITMSRLSVTTGTIVLSTCHGATTISHC